MAEAGNKISSHWWWLDRQNSSNHPRGSSWLQTTLAELDGKTAAMLKLIEEDADSFGRRAEMYYRKRPELISMVEDFYRAHRSLAERYDRVKSDFGARLLSPWASPLCFTKYQTEKLTSCVDKSYDSYSETYGSEESVESEVEDPEQEEQAQASEEVEVSSGVSNDEITTLREELERLREENKIQKQQLVQKDEEKREVIRQLSLAIDVLKEDNAKLRKCVGKESPKKQGALQFNKLREAFLVKLFKGSPES